MVNFFRFFYADASNIFSKFGEIFVAIFKFFASIFNFPERKALLEEYSAEFSTGDWVMLLIVSFVLLALVIVVLFFLIKGLKKLFRFRIPVKKYDELKKQADQLKRDLARANYEKDKLLAMQMHGSTELPAEEHEGKEEEATELILANRNTVNSPCVNPADSRFFRLTMVDNYYKTEHVAPEYDNDISLAALCDRFRSYAANALHLYYDIKLIRHFIASFGTTRIIILQGISGTGKTSLPYAFGKFVQNDSTVVSVQPAWRERTELYGYFNEFTKKYNETDFLRTIYESNYYRDPNLVILDEMNIARVEYYFAEMLSILEMPLESEWKIDCVGAMWDNDPCLINEGKINIANNNWFVGTINNDDSTFAVADKVYDRAIPIDIDSRAEAFEAPPTQPIRISVDHMVDLFNEAKDKYPLSQELLDKVETLNAYLIKTFRLAFGNRIMKQMRDYVPCFIACGGTELDAVDFMIAKKVLRKFESLSLGFMKDELTRFSAYLDKLFGRNTMMVCKDYIEFLKKNN